jgi:hypothetical protein
VDQGLAPAANSTSKRRRNGALAVCAAVLWMAVVFFGWANRTMDDAVPTGVIDDVFTTESVRCSGLFGSGQPTGPLLELEPPREYTRPPCELPHRHGRLVFGINVMFAVLVAVGGVVAIRLKDAPDDGATGLRTNAPQSLG